MRAVPEIGEGLPLDQIEQFVVGQRLLVQNCRCFACAGIIRRWPSRPVETAGRGQEARPAGRRCAGRSFRNDCGPTLIRLITAVSASSCSNTESASRRSSSSIALMASSMNTQRGAVQQHPGEGQPLLVVHGQVLVPAVGGVQVFGQPVHARGGRGRRARLRR